MSSHREAPSIAKDPVADSTDLYAFVSPDAPDTVTVIANYVPLQNPQGGPNFFMFGDDVQYDINISNRGTAEPDVIYRFNFTTVLRNPDTFLYNVGPITSIDSLDWNLVQMFTVTRIAGGESTVLGRDLLCPPCNVGPLSTPNYADLAAQAVHTLSDGSRVFVGQRADGFFVDLGAVFDLLTLRPFQSLNKYEPSGTKNGIGVDGLQGLNVNSIAMQLAIPKVSRDGNTPTAEADAGSVIGVWTTASRQKNRHLDTRGDAVVNSGPFVQVSRLANPLVNEVLIPLGYKDIWNTKAPSGDHSFLGYFQRPGVSADIVALYPNVFPNLANQIAHDDTRPDIVAILLTGLPPGVVPGFQNYTGSTYADMLRLNLAVAPVAPGGSGYSQYGLLGGDASGFPNGRRVADDVVAIELRALAGLTLPLVKPSYTADAAAGVVTDGSSYTNAGPYLGSFPYLGIPAGGEESMPGTPVTGS